MGRTIVRIVVADIEAIAYKKEISIEQVFLLIGHTEESIRRSIIVNEDVRYDLRRKVREFNRNEIVHVSDSTKPLTAAEYEEKSLDGLSSLSKRRRYYTTREGKEFYIDSFEDRNILTLKLDSVNEPYTLPRGIVVLKNVSDDPNYYDYQFAKDISKVGGK